jgi:signal transduction histidine kinase
MKTLFDALAVLDGLSDPLVVLSRAELIVYANAEFRQASGCGDLAIHGKRLDEVWPPLRGLQDHASYLHARGTGARVRFEQNFPGLSTHYEFIAQPLAERDIALILRATGSRGAPLPTLGATGDASEHLHTSLHSRMLAHMGTCLRADLGAAETFYQMACILGQLPGVSRATFGTVDYDARTITIHRDYCNNVPSMTGTYLMRDAETTSEELSRGQLVVITDVRTDYRSRDAAERRFKLGYMACVAVPLMRDNIWAATLMLHAPMPREWTPEEVELIRTAAERTWLAVENVRLLQEARLANAAKDRFLATLSHELRTPLTPVLMMLSALQLHDNIPCDVQKDLAMIRRNIDLETRLIDDLLDVTRIANGKLQLTMRPHPVHELLEHVCQICSGEARSGGIELIRQFAATADVVAGDAARLEQVFWNLIKNAIKFTPQGGRVWVGTSVVEGEILLKVQDTGAGIAPEVLPRIFNAFEQGEQGVTRTYGGLGLGLAISKAIVDLHGGRIWAQSDGHNRGSTLHVALPLTIPPTREPEAFHPGESHQNGHSQARTLRVLLVDDNEDTLDTMQWLLNFRGMRVTTASGIKEALAAAAQSQFDLLISDIGLPDGTGCELIEQMLNTRQIPAIALSGYGQDADIQRSLKAGFAAHLIKPVDFEQLERVIAKIT